MSKAALSKAIAVFLGVATVGGLLVLQTELLERTENRRAATELASAAAFGLEQQLSRTLDAPNALAAVVRESGGLRDFDRVAAELLASYGGSNDSLQVAPGGVLTHIHPLAGNEAALGLRLLEDPLHRPGAMAAIESKRVVLVGPFELRQGGTGLAARVAVFLRAGTGERFWGFASAIVRLPRLLEQSRLGRLADAGYAYRLSREPDAGAPGVVIAENALAECHGEPVVATVTLPNGRWVLAVSPRSGWGTGHVRAGAAVVLVTALVLALLAYRLFRQPDILRREVALRTAELESAHREQQRFEQALQQSQKMEAIGQLAGGVAHDFNNLLSGIRGYAELILRECPPNTLTAEGAHTIVEASDRAAELTAQLLGFARLGKYRQVPVDVHLVIAAVAKLLDRTIDKRITLEQRLGVERPFVLGDPTQLEQVVLNLAVNARDAMPEGGKLTLATSLEGEHSLGPSERGPVGRFLMISVSDTGTGIPAAIRGRIFEPFFTTKEEGRGTGMGLATVYGIVRNHGGAVRFESEEGRGTRFMVYLPHHAYAPEEASRPAPPQRGAGRVLVVDDEEIVRRVAARLLESLGYEVVVVSSASEAVAWVEAHPRFADLALLDLVMPGTDGGACFEQLRALEPDLPVVVTSGFARDGRVQAILDAGAAGFVQKPYRASELGAMVARALGQSARARAS